MREKMLLMGAPGTGKSLQLYKVAQWLNEQHKKLEVIDLEDKFEAFLLSECGEIPSFINLQTTVTWEDYSKAIDTILTRVKPGDWISVDRIDLAWPYVQRWYSQAKYQEDKAEKLTKSSLAMKKSSMFTPFLDQGAWQVVNENYESMIYKLLFLSRCNLMLTSGIKGVDENSPRDVFGSLGVIPRGQKELGHQPHSVFLLQQKRDKDKDLTWTITTAKDLPKRVWFKEDPIFDLSVQYISEYVK